MKLKKVFKRARKEKWAVPQLNFSTFAQNKGIIQAGIELDSPINLGTSEGESNFLGMRKVVKLTFAT